MAVHRRAFTAGSMKIVIRLATGAIYLSCSSCARTLASLPLERPIEAGALADAHVAALLHRHACSESSGD